MNTLFDKIWDKHVVQVVDDGPTQLYIDRLYCHEVTSPQAFEGLRSRGLKCFRPDHIYCMPDHNTPTHDQDKPIEEPVSKKQVDTLAANCKEFGLTHYGMYSPDNGIIHVVGPEKGLSLPTVLWVPWLSALEHPRWRWLWPRSASCSRSLSRCASPSTANCRKAWWPRT